jgi:hypothetical protein
MASGITLQMRHIRRPAPQPVRPEDRRERDRSLPGKARICARREAKRRARRAFFSGYGVASENAYNLRYDCGACGFGIVAPLDDFEFMADVMEHEAEHADGAR